MCRLRLRPHGHLFAAVAKWRSDALPHCLTHAQEMVAGLPLALAACATTDELWLGDGTCGPMRWWQATSMGFPERT